MAKAKSAPRENNPTVIGVTQYLDPEYWDWANPVTSERRNDRGVIVDNRLGLTLAEAQELLDDGTVEQIADYLVKRLEFKGDFFTKVQTDETLEAHPGTQVIEAYGIIHDKDERQVWSEVEQRYITELKPRHIHLVIKFRGRQKGQSAPLGYLAKRLGIEPQYVEKPGRGAHAYDNMLAYLVHVKYTDKFQYSPSEVATVRGRDYMEIHSERRADWLKGRAKVTKRRAAEGVDELREKIRNGEVTWNQVLLTDEYFEIYDNHQKAIEDSFRARMQRKSLIESQRMLNGEFEKFVLYVYGRGRVGKSTFIIKRMLPQLIAQLKDAGLNVEVYVAGKKNGFDGWFGQEVVIVDDMRPGSARSGGIPAEEFLGLLDREMPTTISARYKSKENFAPRVVIQLAPWPPEEYYAVVKDEALMDEPLDQYMGRISMTMEVLRESGSSEMTFNLRQVKEGQPYERWVSVTTKDRNGDPKTIAGMYPLTYRESAPLVIKDESLIVGALASEVAQRVEDFPKLKELPRSDWDEVEADHQIEAYQQRQIDAYLEYIGADVAPPVPSPWDPEPPY